MNDLTSYGFRLGPFPRMRWAFRRTHYGVFTPFVAFFGMIALLFVLGWYMIKATVWVLVVLCQLIARASSAKTSGQTTRK